MAEAVPASGLRARCAPCMPSAIIFSCSGVFAARPWAADADLQQCLSTPQSQLQFLHGEAALHTIFFINLGIVEKAPKHWKTQVYKRA